MSYLEDVTDQEGLSTQWDLDQLSQEEEELELSVASSVSNPPLFTTIVTQLKQFSGKKVT